MKETILEDDVFVFILGPERRELEAIADFQLPIVELIHAARSP